MYLVHLAITVLDSDMNTIIIVVVVHTLTYRYNAVRGHRTGSNNSGVEDSLPQEENK